ncbi:MAG: pilus assembly protein [Propionibacteriaceae bacterium]|nr:pilus assembly protein [Propionibacteriaceae bacterium]
MLTHRVASAPATPPSARDQRGLSESTQWALVLPTLLAVLLGLVQTGVWLHGRTVATQAAGAAADAAAMGHAAEPAAMAIASRGGLTEVTIRTSRDTGTVSVTVSGRVPTFFDLGQGQVSGEAIVGLEQVTRP